MFQEILHLRVAVVLCYNQQPAVRIISCVLQPLIWHIFQFIVDVLFLIISICVLNQFLNVFYCFECNNHYVLKT
jgi:hypothetical protein